MAATARNTPGALPTISNNFSSRQSYYPAPGPHRRCFLLCLPARQPAKQPDQQTASQAAKQAQIVFYTCARNILNCKHA